MNAKTKANPRPHSGGSYKLAAGKLERIQGPSKEPTPDHVAKAKAAKAREPEPDTAKDAGETNTPAKAAGSDAKAKG